MKYFNVHEAKTHLSRLLARVVAGEEIIIANAGVPIARLIPMAGGAERPLGTERGRMLIARDFDAALPADVLKGFDG